MTEPHLFVLIFSMPLSTKLEAINSMLSAIGEAPINKLDENTVDSTIATSTLEEVNRNVQSFGWHFNSEKDYPLEKADDGTIPISSDILRVDVDERTYSDIDVVQRNGKLYDKKNHTYTFKIDLKADIIRLLEWDDLPQPFRAYVIAKATRIFQQRMVGATDLASPLAQDEVSALVNLREFEMDTADYNVFDNFDVAKVLIRR